MKIKPRKSQVVVKPKDKESNVGKYGLITPSNVEQDQKAIGTVIAVGSDIDDIKEGNTVIYGAYAGEKIKFNEDDKEVEYVILFDEDVLAFMEE